MLTAWDKVHERPLVLPDFDTRDQLEMVRSRARHEELLCPTCRQLLWLRAGDIRTHHFGHRALNDCPAATISEAVLAARRQLYRFFKVRVDAGKLAAEIELEPRAPSVANLLGVDMLLRRAQKPPVAIFIVENSLKPDTREALLAVSAKEAWCLRPVFLQARLKMASGSSEDFLLDTTQRDLKLPSPYDHRAQRSFHGSGTLHFIDTDAERWTTLRGLSLVHEPQLFVPVAVRQSSLTELLWSEVYSEWVHPGEAEALKAFREAESERRRKESQARLASLATTRLSASVLSAALSDHDHPQSEEISATRAGEEEIEPPLPPWIADGLVCVGCGQRTTAWQNASPGQDACVCRSCFVKGIRLES